MKNSKQIAIVGWHTGDNSFGVSKAYLEYFSRWGNVTILTPNIGINVKSFDLLVLPGGRDVNPARYNTAPSFFTGHPEPCLEFFDEHLLQKFIDANVSIFGICRGHQTLGVHFGVPLIQHIDGFHPKSLKTRSELVHPVWSREALTHNNFAKNKIIQEVNSLHHQAIFSDDILNNEDCGLQIELISKDGLVEAMSHKKHPIVSVQWHPKFFGAC